MIEMIDQKMKEGYVFFLITPRLRGMAAPTKEKLTEPKDALIHRAVAISLAAGDKAVAGLIEAGTATPVKTPDKPIRGARKAKTAKEAAKGETIAVRPGKGG